LLISGAGELLADLDPYYALITAGVVTIAARAFSPVVESIKKYSIPVRLKEEARTENANPQRPCPPPPEYFDPSFKNQTDREIEKGIRSLKKGMLEHRWKIIKELRKKIQIGM